MDTTPHTMRALDVAALCASGHGPSSSTDRWMLVIVAHAASDPAAFSRAIADTYTIDYEQPAP